MKKNLNLVKRAVGITALAGIAASIFTGCTKEYSPVEAGQKPTYAISGVVVDGSGSDGKSLAGVGITYGISGGSTAFTDKNGSFEISGLDYGNKAFNIVYLPDENGVEYTSARLYVDGDDRPTGDEEIDSMEIDYIQDRAGIVKLYPLNGALQGTVIGLLHSRDIPTPIEGAIVTVKLKPSIPSDWGDFQKAAINPSSFTGKTDVNGQFLIENLPVSCEKSDLTVMISDVLGMNPATQKAITWEMDQANVNVVLSSGDTTVMEEIVMAPTSKIDLRLVKTNFSNGILGADQALEFEYSQPLDSAKSYVAVNVNGEGNIPTTITYDETLMKMTVTPAITFPSNAVVQIRGEVFGKNGHSETINYTVNVTESGLAYVASSNVLTAGKLPLYDISKTAPVTFTFTQNIAGEPSVLVSGEDYSVVVDPVTPNLLTITPKRVWNGPTSETIRVRLNLEDGTPVDFTTTLNLERALDLLKSSAVNGASVGDNIVIVANKALSKAVVKLTKGAEEIALTSSVSNDSILIDPIYDLEYETAYSLTINALTADGETVTEVFNFTTEKPQVYVTWSNMVDVNGNPATGFGIFEPMKFVFNKKLDTDIHKIEWNAPNFAGFTGTNKTVIGDITDANVNASVVYVEVTDAADTLMIMPDSRTNHEYGDNLGVAFKVYTTNGEESSNLNFVVKTRPMGDYIKWINTRDSLGYDLEMDPRAPIKVVYDFTIARIEGVQAPSVGTAVKSLALDNFTTSGDTLIYTPSVTLDPNVTNYGFRVTAELTNGMKHVVLPEFDFATASAGNIMSVNNRENGDYRLFSAAGDSLVVEFENAIDPTKPFAVNNFVINYTIALDATGKVVTIKPADTLDVVDYKKGGIDAAYTNLTFDLTTATGIEFTAENFGADIDIYTEEGLVLTNASYLMNHMAGDKVLAGAAVKNEFGKDSVITLTFNREIDTTLIKAGLEDEFFQFVKGALPLPKTLAFPDAKTVTVTPVAALEYGSSYEVIMTDVPGAGIENASANNVDGGTLNLNLVTQFTVEPKPVADISAMAVVIDTAAMKTKGSTDSLGTTPVPTNFDALYPINSAASLTVVIQEAAWNADRADSITHYQARFSADGTTFISNDALVAVKPWNPLEANGDTTYQSFAMDAIIISELEMAEVVAGSNGDHIFNQGQTISVQIRPVFATGGTAADIEAAGPWSNTIMFNDDVAPADEKFVTAANITTIANGGVAVVATPSTGANVFDNSAGAAGDVTGTVTLTFPEDMDVTTTPVMTIADSDVGTLPLTPAQTGLWVSARQYVFTLTVPAANVDFGAAGEFLFSVSVAGVKDASGVTIPAWGTRVDYNGGAGTDNAEGSNCLTDWTN